MGRDVLNRVHNKLFGDQEVYPFEIRFILYTSLVIGLLSIISIIFGLFLNLTPLLAIVHIVLVLGYGGIYYLGRFRKNDLLAKRLMTVTTLLFVNVLWFLNSGSKGPVPFSFVILYTILTFIWDQKSLNRITLILILNLFGLFIVDVYYPNLLTDYPNEKARLIDLYLGLVFYLGLAFVLSYVAMSNYQREFQKAKRSDQLKSAFLANMSHEVRTPLNSIVGFSELLCDEDLPPEKRERFVQIIQDNNHSLLRLIEDILDVSRIESNQLNIEMEPCNLNELLTNLDLTYKNIVENKGLNEVKILCSVPNHPIVIEADPSRLHQVFINLLDNSLKFTEKGSVSIGFSENGNTIQFYVKDTGIGIKDVHHQKLFERFYKVEDNNGKIYKGTGIGLSLSKDLIELMGGKIWVESTYGEGTSFYFTLPKNTFVKKR